MIPFLVRVLLCNPKKKKGWRTMFRIVLLTVAARKKINEELESLRSDIKAIVVKPYGRLPQLEIRVEELQKENAALRAFLNVQVIRHVSVGERFTVEKLPKPYRVKIRKGYR
jgi:hypothetical protein